MLEKMPNIAILSGEGEIGTWDAYDGPDTLEAIQARIVSEKCGGDRWASVWRRCHVLDCGQTCYTDIHSGNQRGLTPKDFGDE